MPNRSSSKKPPADEVDSAFATMHHIIRATEGESPENRITDLERLCAEVRDFARVAEMPQRVIDALDGAAQGLPVGPSLLPITMADFSRETPAVALGRAGGLKGGKARAEALSGRRRREIARKAAASRWKGRGKP